MSYKVIAIAPFLREVRRLIKKYPSLKKELQNLEERLESEPYTGTPIGKNCYKIRIAISSKGKGKSGGGRVISHVYVTANTVFLLAIYDKSEISNIDNESIVSRLKEIKQ